MTVVRRSAHVEALEDGAEVERDDRRSGGDAGGPGGDPDVDALDLDERERAHYQTWAPLARKNGTLTRFSYPDFVGLCQVAAMYDAARAQVTAVGMLQEMIKVDDVTGAEVSSFRKNPLMVDVARLWQLRARGLERFGLTGAGALVEKPKTDDARAELLKLIARR